MKPIKVYGTRNCPYCVKVKQFFTDKGWQFEDIDLTGKPDEIAALSAKTNFRTVPQVFIGDEFYGGCDDILKLDSEGELAGIVGAS